MNHAVCGYSHNYVVQAHSFFVKHSRLLARLSLMSLCVVRVRLYERVIPFKKKKFGSLILLVIVLFTSAYLL